MKFSSEGRKSPTTTTTQNPSQLGNVAGFCPLADGGGGMRLYSTLMGKSGEMGKFLEKWGKKGEKLDAIGRVAKLLN